MKLETLCLPAGQSPDPATNARAVPIARTSSYVFYSIVNICRAGDEIVSANNLYGGSYTQFNDILPQFNINAWMFLQGIETLPLRMECHCRNAKSVEEHLKGRRGVTWVRDPGLPGDPAHEMQKKYLPHGGGAMVVFGIESGMEADRRFIESLELFSHLANVGDAKSLAIHPATTTCSQLSADKQTEVGIPPEMVRLSIGLEHIDDIIADIDQALDKTASS